jgi:hypothetical protein
MFDWAPNFLDWVQGHPTWLLGLFLLGAMVGASWFGASFTLLRGRFRGEQSGMTETQQGHVLTSVYTLVGLLFAFTFGMAIDRFEQRRALVLQDANAIETLYVDAQLLPEPHRSRFSNLLVHYARNHIELAEAQQGDAQANRLLLEDQSLNEELREAMIPAFNSIRTIDFSSSFVDAVNEVIRTDAARRAARRAQVPESIIILLMFYALIAAVALGSFVGSHRGAAINLALMALFVLTFMLLSDINRPTSGTVRENQEPMQRMLNRIERRPTSGQPRASVENPPASALPSK